MKNLILIYLVLIALVSSTRIISVLDHSLQDDKTLLSTSEGVVVGIAPELLSRNLEVGSELFLDLGSSYRYEGKVKSKNTDVNGVTTYVAGLAASKFGHAIISVANGQVRMNVDIPSEGKNFGVRHNKGINEHILFEHNLSDVLEGTHPGYLPNKDSKNGMFQKSPDAGKKIQAGVDDPAILDVLVVYTTAAFSWAGDQESMDLVISSMIAKSNEALTTSETGIVINLVHSALVEYEEIDPVTDINNLTTPSQEVFQEVHDLRDQYYADFVVLLEYTDQTGGIGWLLENSDGDESLAFSITRIQQASFSYTTIHEIGHNMGCGHHKEQNFQEGPGLFSYSAGWRWTTSSEENHCSIMSYTLGSYYDDGVTHTQVGLFSSPDLTDGEVAAGDAVDGDNRMNLLNLKHICAAYRSSPCLEEAIEANPIGTRTVTFGETTTISALSVFAPIVDDASVHAFSSTLNGGNSLPDGISFTFSNDPLVIEYTIDKLGCPQTYSIDLILEDVCRGTTQTSTWTLEFTENPAPTYVDGESVGTQTLTVGTAWDYPLNGYWTDDENDLTYSTSIVDRANYPDWMDVSETDPSFSGTPTGCSDDFDLKVTVQDSCEDNNQDYVFNVIVNKPEPTETTPITKQTVSIGDTETKTISGLDVFSNIVDDSDVYSFTSTEAGKTSLPAGVSFTFTNDPLVIEWDITAPTTGCSATYSIDLVLEDKCKGTTQTSTWTLEYENPAPTYVDGKSVETQTLTVGTAWDYPLNGYWTDDETDLTYSISIVERANYPDWMDVSETDPSFSGTPTGCSDDFDLKVTVQDSCEDNNQDYVFNVIVNKPEPTETTTITQQTFSIGDTETTTISGSNVFSNIVDDSDIYSFTSTETDKTSLPAGVSFTFTNDPLVIEWDITPPTTSDQCSVTYSIDLVLEDKCKDTTQTSTWTLVFENNPAPTYVDGKSVETQNLTVGTAWDYPLNGYWTDDETDLAYSTSIVDRANYPDWMDVSETDPSFSGTPTGCSDNFDLKVTVQDSCEDNNQDYVFNVIVNKPEPTETTPITKQTLPIGDFPTKVISGLDVFSNIVDDSEIYFFTSTETGKTSLPAGVTFKFTNDPLVIEWDITAPTTGCPQTYSIDLVLEDKCKDTTQTSTWTLEYENPTPTYVDGKSVETQNLTVGRVWDYPLNGYWTDDETDLTYSISIVERDNYPDWMDVSETDPSFSGTPTGCSDNFDLKVTVQDSCEDNNQDYVFNVIVNKPEPTETTPITKQTLPIGISSTKTISGLDVFSNIVDDSDIYSFTSTETGKTSLPTGVSFTLRNDPMIILWQITAPYTGCSATYSIDLVLEDKCKDTTQTSNWTLEYENPTPTYVDGKSVETQNLTVGTAWDYPLNGYWTDDENDLTYSTSIVDRANYPDWMDVSETDPSFSGTPTGCSDDFDLKVTVQDSCEDNNQDYVFNVIVNKPEPTETTPITQQTLQIGDTETTTISGSNVFSNIVDDSDIYSFTSTEAGKTSLPAGVSFTFTNDPLVIEWDITPPTTSDQCSETYSIDLVLEDKCKDTTQTSTWTLVFENNPAPTYVDGKSVGTQTLTVGTAWDYPLNGYWTDDENDLTYSTSIVERDNYPDWMDVSETDPSFSGTPTGCSDDFDLKVTVQDSCEDNNQDYVFNVIVNKPEPTETTPITKQTFSIGDTETTTISGSNVFSNIVDDSDVYSFTSTETDKTSLPAGVSFTFTNDPLVIEWDITPPSTSDQCSETYSIDLVLEDKCKDTTQTSTWALEYGNNPAPTYVDGKSVGTQNLTVGTAWDYPLNGYWTDDETDLTYSISIVERDNYPDWMDVSETDPSFSGTPTGCSDNFDLKVTVQDSCEDNNQDYVFNVIVNKPEPTETTPITKQTFSIGDTETKTITGSNVFSNIVDDSDIYSFTSTEAGKTSLPNGVSFTFSNDPLVIEWDITAPTTGCSETYSIDLVLEDKCKDTTQTSTWTLEFINGPLTKIKDFDTQSVETGSSFEFDFPSSLYSNPETEDITVEAFDSNGEVLTGWVLFNKSQNQFYGTAPTEANQFQDIIVTVTDTCADHQSLSYPFKINVIDTTTPPALENAIGTIELDTTTEWEFEVPDETFSGTDLEYSASPYSESNIKSSASPYIAEESEVWWSFESESKMFSGTTPAGCESEWQIELTASNSQGSKSDIFVVSVSNPAVTSNDLLTAQTAYSNQRFVYELETDAFIDSQDDSLTYSADVILDGDQIASLPTWLKIDASTGTFTGTPKYKQCSETLNIRVNANDDCPDNGASDNFELEIVNERPTTNYQSTTYEAIVAQEFEFSLGDNIFSDEYLNRIKIYSKVKNDEGKFEAKPYWLLFDKDTFTFYGEVPKTECSQELNVYVFATDKCHKRVSVNFILQITRPDIQPNPDYPLPTQTIHQHKDFVFYFEKKQLFTKPVSCKYNYDAYLYNGNANDETIDQNLLEDLPSWIQFSERDLSFSGNYQETVCEEVYQIVIMAMDKCENTAFNQFQIIVQDNLPVVYVPLKTQRIRGRRRWNYIFDENSFMDPENTELTYQAFEHTPFPFTNKLSSQTTDDLQPLPDWIDFDPQTRSFTGKIPPHQCDGQLNIAVVAQDECLSKTRAEFALKVNNLAPRVKNELEPKTLIKGNTIDFFIPEDTFVDPEGGKLTYGFHTNIRQHWLDLDKDTGRFTGYVAYNIGRTATISVYAIDVCGNKKQTPLEFNFKMPVESENDDQP